MLSAICINLDRSTILLSGSGLMRNMSFVNFENIMGKEENDGNQNCLLFPQCFLPFQGYHKTGDPLVHTNIF